MECKSKEHYQPQEVDGQVIMTSKLTPVQSDYITNSPFDYIWMSENKKEFYPYKHSRQEWKYMMVTKVPHMGEDVCLSHTI